MALPLVSDLRVDGLGLRVGDHERGDLLELRNRLGGLLAGLSRRDRVNPSGNLPARVLGHLSGLLEADCGIGTEPHVPALAVPLVAEQPGLRSALANHEHQPVFVDMPPHLRGLGGKFRQIAHGAAPQLAPQLAPQFDAHCSDLSRTVKDANRTYTPEVVSERRWSRTATDRDYVPARGTNLIFSR
jgi:hypothetical protein